MILAPESGLPNIAATPVPLRVGKGGKCRYRMGPGKISLLGRDQEKGRRILLALVLLGSWTQF